MDGAEIINQTFPNEVDIPRKLSATKINTSHRLPNNKLSGDKYLSAFY